MSILPNTASNLDQWNLLLAFVTPFLIALVHQPSMGKWVKMVVTVGICIAVATINTAIQQNLDLSNWLHSVLIVLVGAIAFYHTVLSRVVPAVESRTNMHTDGGGNG